MAINQPGSTGPDHDEHHPATEFPDRAAIENRDQRARMTLTRPIKNGTRSTGIS